MLRRLTVDDAAFILELLTDPAFMRFVGDRGVRNIEDARNYIVHGPLESYERLGFGLLRVELKDTGVAIGICGLLKRPALDDVDLGFAVLPQFRGAGYAYESAAAVMGHARADLALERIVAIANPANAASIRVLEKIGLRFDRMIRLSAEGPEVGLYVGGLRGPDQVTARAQGAGV